MSSMLHELAERQEGIPQEPKATRLVRVERLLSRSAEECPLCHARYTKVELRLSARRRQLLDALVAGKVDKEIAVELGLALQSIWR